MENIEKLISDRARNLLNREPPLLIRYGTLIIVFLITIFSVVFVYMYLDLSK